MKKNLLTLIIIFTVPISLFANDFSQSQYRDMMQTENSVRLSQKKDMPPEQRIKRNAIASISAGSVLTAVSLAPLSGFIAIAAVTAGNPNQQNFGAYMFCYPLLTTFVQLLISGCETLAAGAVMMPFVGDYDKTKYKYTMSKLMRNLGIVTLTTLTVPLALSLSEQMYLTATKGEGVLGWLGFDLPVMLSQLIVGIVLLTVGINRTIKWSKMISPDIAITHDDKKDYTEGYGVSVGMRVRI